MDSEMDMDLEQQLQASFEAESLFGEDMDLGQLFQAYFEAEDLFEEDTSDEASVLDSETEMELFGSSEDDAPHLSSGDAAEQGSQSPPALAEQPAKAQRAQPMGLALPKQALPKPTPEPVAAEMASEPPAETLPPVSKAVRQHPRARSRAVAPAQPAQARTIPAVAAETPLNPLLLDDAAFALPEGATLDDELDQMLADFERPAERTEIPQPAPPRPPRPAPTPDDMDRAVAARVWGPWDPKALTGPWYILRERAPFADHDPAAVCDYMRAVIVSFRYGWPGKTTGPSAAALYWFQWARAFIHTWLVRSQHLFGQLDLQHAWCVERRERIVGVIGMEELLEVGEAEEVIVGALQIVRECNAVVERTLRAQRAGAMAANPIVVD